MTQEERQLLLEDLCARLPYGVFINTTKGDGTLDTIQVCCNNDVICSSEKGHEIIDCVKPYLRTMSSMTEEERNEATQFEINNLGPIGFNWNLLVSNSSELVNWLNAHHFDYRGLIKKGLAIEAPEDMYKTE